MGIFRGGEKTPQESSNPSSKDHAQFLADALRAAAGKVKASEKGGACSSSSGSTSTQASSKCGPGDIRLANFTISNVPGQKHMVFIPDRQHLTPATLQHICNALGREVPLAFLRGDGSISHSSRMSTGPLRTCPAFQALMTEAKNGLQNRGAGPRANDGMGCCCAWPPGLEHELEGGAGQDLIEAVDSAMEKKIAPAVSSIAGAASRTNVWTVSGPKISSFELFLQQCIEMGVANDVFRLSVAHMQDKAYMECKMAKQMFKNLFEVAHPLNFPAEARPTTSLFGDLWDHGKNKSHPEFAEHGYDNWSFNKYNDESVTGHPIASWPWPYADLFIIFFHEDGADANWNYTTEERLTMDAVPVSLERLGTVGHVFIGGNQLQMKRKMLHAMQALGPVVLIDNTPDAVKQMSLLMNVLKKAWDRGAARECGPFLRDGASIDAGSPSMDILQAMVPAKILRYVETEFDSSHMDQEERLLLSDIVGLLDLARRRPQVFKEMFCVLEPLQGSPEHTASFFASALASSSAGYTPNSSAVSRALALGAWRLHLRIVKSATRLKRRSNATYVVVAILIFLAVALAICVVALGIEKAQVRNVGFEEIDAALPHATLHIKYTTVDLCVLRVILLLLPIAAGLLAAVESRSQTPQRWAGAHSSASRVVAEIYQFLSSAGPYNLGPVGNQKRFSRRLAAAERQLANLERDLMQYEEAISEGWPKDNGELQDHINQHLYGISPPGSCYKRLRNCTAGLLCCRSNWPWTAMMLAGEEPRDLSSPLTAEMYMEMRTVPLRRCYSKRADSLARCSFLLQSLTLLSLLIVSVLGMCGLSLWIPIPLSLASLLMTLARWFSSPDTLAAVQSGLRMLDDLCISWQEMGVKEHRAEATRQRLVCTIEGMFITIANIDAHASFMPEAEADDDELDSDQEQSRVMFSSGKGKEWRSQPIKLAAEARSPSTPASLLSLG